MTPYSLTKLQNQTPFHCFIKYMHYCFVAEKSLIWMSKRYPFLPQFAQKPTLFKGLHGSVPVPPKHNLSLVFVHEDAVNNLTSGSPGVKPHKC